MFGQNIADANASYLSNEEALAKIITDTSLDVVVVVAGQPAKLFADMRPEAGGDSQLLRLDDKAPETTGHHDLLFRYHSHGKLSQLAHRGYSHAHRQGFSLDLRLRPAGDERFSEPFRSFAVYQLRPATKSGTPQVERSEHGITAAWQRLVLLPAHGT
jgi:hypothetical protein